MSVATVSVHSAAENGCKRFTLGISGSDHTVPLLTDVRDGGDVMRWVVRYVVMPAAATSAITLTPLQRTRHCKIIVSCAAISSVSWRNLDPSVCNILPPVYCTWLLWPGQVSSKYTAASFLRYESLNSWTWKLHSERQLLTERVAVGVDVNVNRPEGQLTPRN